MSRTFTYLLTFSTILSLGCWMDPDDIHESITDSSAITITVTSASTTGLSGGDSSSGDDTSSTGSSSGDISGTSGSTTSAESTSDTSGTSMGSTSSGSSGSTTWETTGAMETDGHYCGDGIVDPGEECDTEPLDPLKGWDCQVWLADPNDPAKGYNYPSNPLKATFPCNEFCFVDTSYCRNFQDGKITTDDSIPLKFVEPCDQALPPPTCKSLGFDVLGSAICKAVPEKSKFGTIFRNELDLTPCMP